MVKTRKFKSPKYIGDPVNSSRIFNELFADELIIVDIGRAHRKNAEIDYQLIESLASECFMPLTYGGKITRVEEASKIIRLGVEKIALNSAALSDPALISAISKEIGSSSTVVSVDVKVNPITKRFVVYQQSGRPQAHRDAAQWINECVSRGAGEILLTDVSREGTWSGMREELIQLARVVPKVPVIVNGGISSINEAEKVLRVPGINALGIGNLACFQKQGMGVLVNYPEEFQ